MANTIKNYFGDEIICSTHEKYVEIRFRKSKDSKWTVILLTDEQASLLSYKIDNLLLYLKA